MTILQAILPALTGIVALYGAALSTYNAVHSHRKDRRSLKVRTSTSMYTYGADLGPPMLNIEVVNDGHRSVVADPPQIATSAHPGKVMLLMGAHGLADFPKRLEEGEVGSVRIGYREVAEALMHAGVSGKTQLTALCKDSTGREYRSKAMEVDVNEWLKMGA